MTPGLIRLINAIVKGTTSATVKEGISRIKDALEEKEPSQPTPPKPPVPTEQLPKSPVIQPKPQEPAQPTEEQILAFAQTSPDLQNLVSRYSKTLSNRHTNPLDSMFNPQGQKFLPSWKAWSKPGSRSNQRKKAMPSTQDKGIGSLSPVIPAQAGISKSFFSSL